MAELTAHYLRISLLKRCNLNCFYCRPGDCGQLRSEYRDPAAFSLAIKVLHSIGVSKVRFTGGEPTLYKPLVNLVDKTRMRHPRTHLAVTTNGVTMRRLAAPLASAGLDSVNISLDTVDREKFARLTGHDKILNVIAGIEEAAKYIPSVKLNCVAMAGVNDDEIESMAAFADSLAIDLRFIEYMPNRCNPGQRQLYISGSQVRKSLPFPLAQIPTEISSAARYYRADQLRIRLGFIESVSRPFCAGCNRLRLTSEGNLHGCLFSSHRFNLFDALRRGDQYALSQVRQLIDSKERRGCGVTDLMQQDLPDFVGMGG